MEQPVNNSAPEKETQVTAPPATSATDLTMVGRFSRYTSIFWQAILPFLSVRYLFEGTDILFGPNKKIRKNDRIFGKFKDEGIQKWLTSNIATIAFGAAINAFTAFYTRRTYKDIKTLSAEAVGYELGKDPKEVKFHDMRKSQNAIVKTTTHSLVTRTIKRLSAGFTFFIPWAPLFNSKKYRHKGNDDLDNVGLKLGSGVMGAYLFSDGFLRKQSLFEAMQEMVDVKINHTTADPNILISASDIDLLFNLNERAENKAYKPPVPNSLEAQRNRQLSTLIADMMNHTYNTAPPDANFTVGKFVYLLGNGYLDTFPNSLGYVELASKSKDMQEVKAAAAAIKGGNNPEAVFQEFGIRLDNPFAPAPAQAGSAEPAASQYAQRVQQTQARVPQMARKPQDFAATQENPAPARV